jgi:hypothetical protein
MLDMQFSAFKVSRKHMQVAKDVELAAEFCPSGGVATCGLPTLRKLMLDDRWCDLQSMHLPTRLMPHLSFAIGCQHAKSQLMDSESNLSVVNSIDSEHCFRALVLGSCRQEKVGSRSKDSSDKDGWLHCSYRVVFSQWTASLMH